MDRSYPISTRYRGNEYVVIQSDIEMYLKFSDKLTYRPTIAIMYTICDIYFSD